MSYIIIDLLNIFLDIFFNINVQSSVQVRAGLKEVPLNFGTEQINLNTHCGIYVDNTVLDKGNDPMESKPENDLKFVMIMFLNALYTIIIPE